METVAICPTLTLEMSSSPRETVIVIVLSLISSAKPELELELELDEVPVPPVLDPVAALCDAAELEELPLETVCPIESLESEAIVPLAGA
jgi:hypothetical protein